MSKNSKSISKKSELNRLEKFQAERLTADEMYNVNGGMRVNCTCGTWSSCDEDGTDDGDC